MYSTDQFLDGQMCTDRAIYTQASMAEQAPKRPRFIATRPPGGIRKPTPKAQDLIPAGGRPAPIAPPPDVVAKLGKRCLVAAVDVETHDWEGHKGVKGEVGQCGFYSICHPNDLDARIVQLGWAVGTAPDVLVAKEYVVQPSGYQISEKAARYHGIRPFVHTPSCTGREQRSFVTGYPSPKVSLAGSGRWYHHRGGGQWHQ